MVKEDYRIKVERKLKRVSKGDLLIEKCFMHREKDVLKTENLNGCSDGKGMMEVFSVFPGIEVSFNHFLAERFHFHHVPLKSVMQINHCRQGRIGWEMKDGLSIYLGSGDLSLHTLDSCADCEMSFPLGFYEGISISVDIEKLTDHPLEVLNDTGIEIRDLMEKFCGKGEITAMPASDKIEHIFSGMYGLPEQMYIPYFKIKCRNCYCF